MDVPPSRPRCADEVRRRGARTFRVERFVADRGVPNLDMGNTILDPRAQVGAR